MRRSPKLSLLATAVFAAVFFVSPAGVMAQTASSTPTPPPTPTPLATLTCVNPGTAPGTTDYGWVSSSNLYQLCQNQNVLNPVLQDQDYQLQLVNLVSDTPTPVPTPDDVGCIPDNSNDYRTCENVDTLNRVEARGVYWQPVIAFALVAGFALMIRRNNTI